MSKSIDERIVRMQFDNASFENNISQSMSSLDKFNNQLNGLGPEAQKTGSHFSAFSEIATGAMRQLGASITNFVESKLHALIQPLETVSNKIKGMVEDLTVEQIGAGWEKYTSKAESVQTMMGATREYYTEMLGDEYSMEKQLGLINEQMEKLNWYTDETSYSYSDMANNIAKFTSNGIALEDATDAMMGIANWGAAAGAKNVEVGRAMYNISQAMATGAMTRIDWKSIENANMATSEFKQMAAQAAVLEGTLIDLGDGMYQTLNGDQWNVNTLFQDALKERWLDTDVMMDTFDQYGQFAAQLYDLGQLIDENNIEGLDLVSQQLELIDAWKQGKEEGKEYNDLVNELTESYGLTKDQINELMPALDILSDKQYELGMRAFRAGQEYKTFSDVVEATADAASTHWMNIFEKIFGDLLTAKGLWSQMGETFYEIFVSPLDTVSDALDSWIEKGGRDDFFEGIMNSLEAILNVVQAVGEVLYETFFAGLFDNDAEGLVKLSAAFKDWSEKIKAASEDLDWLQGILRGFIAVIRLPIDFIRSFVGALINVARYFGLFGGSVKEAAGGFGEWLAEVLPKKENFDAFFLSIGNGLLKAKAAMDKFLDSKFHTSFAKIAETIKNAVQKIKDAFENRVLSNIKNNLDSMGEAFSGFGDKVERRFSPLKKVFEVLGKVFQAFLAVLKAIAPIATKLLNFIGDAISAFADGIIEALSTGDFNTVFDIINGGILAGIGIGLKSFIDNIAGIGKESKGVLGGIKGILENIGGVFEGWQKKLNAEALKDIAVAIGIIAASLFVLSMVDSERLTTALIGISVVFGELAGFMALMNKMNSSSNLWGAITGLIDAKAMDKNATSLIKVAAAVMVLAVAVKMLASMSWEELAKGLVSVAALLLAMTVALNKMPKNSTRGSAAALAMAVAITILASAVKKFGSLSWEELGKGLLGTVALIAAMTIALRAFPKDAPKGAASMVVLGAALAIVAQVVKTFASMSLDELARGLIATGVALGELVLAVKLMPKDSVKGGGTLILMAAALAIVAEVVEKFASMELNSLAQGLIALGAALAEMVIAMNLMNGSVGGAAALMLMAVAIGLFVPSILLLGSVDPMKIVQGLLALAGAFAVIGVAGLLLGPLAGPIALLAGAITLMGIAMLAAGAGIALFSVWMTALAASGSIAFQVLIDGIMMLVAALPQIAAGFATAMTALITTLADNATQITTSFGTLVSAVLTEVNRLLPEIGEFLVNLGNTIFTTLNTLIPDIITTIETFITSILQLITDLAPKVGEAVVAICSAALDAVNELVPQIVETVLNIIDQLLASLAEHVPNFVDSGLAMVQGILEGIAEHIGEIVIAFIDIILETIQAIEAKIPDIVQEGWNLIIAIINGIAQGIEDNMVALHEAMNRLAKAMIDFVKEFLGIRSSGGGESQLFHDDVGVSIIEGIKGGINAVKETLNSVMTTVMNGCKSAAQTVANTFHEVGSNIVNGIKNGINWAADGLRALGSSIVNWVRGGAETAAQIESPSKVFYGIGQYMDEGLMNGLIAGERDLFNAGRDISNTAISAVQEAMAHAGDVIDDDMMMTPVIRPVVDLSEIEAGSSKMHNLLNKGIYTTGIGGFGISGMSTNAQLVGAINSMQANQSANPYSGINIYVTGGDGANAEEIADEVMKRLDREVQRRKAAFG